jgi:hypothetical protein
MMKPGESVVPIFAIDENNNIESFLGTGTFVGEKPYLVTAYHVIKGWKCLFAIAFINDLQHLHRLNVLKVDEEVDLAVLETPECKVNQSIQLAADDEINFNQQVVCYEYGTTQTLGKHIHLAPATRLGNVTRSINLTELYGRAGESILELSFPALRGASGSPVMSNFSFHLLGIVIANVEYHLLPAQIESVLDEKNSLLEEKRYLLPQALAVNVKHLRELIATLE